MPEPENIDFARLLGWVEGRLPEEEARAVEEQVEASSDETRATVAWLRAFAWASDNVSLGSPPPEVQDAIVERFEARAEDRHRPGLLRRLVATLASDSGLEPAFGARSAATQESRRHFVYSTDEADIALNVWPRPDDGGFDVDGQVLLLNGAEPGSFAVQLVDAGTEVGTTATDEVGEFFFDAVPPGVYEVFISGARAEIWIPHIELRDSI